MPQQPKISINVKEIIADIKAGMADVGLMDKYELSLAGLKSVFNKLVDGKFVTEQEIENRQEKGHDTIDIDDPRKSLRMELKYTVTVCEAANQSNQGTVWDLSATGIGIQGLKTEVGEIKTILVQPDASTEVEPFRLTVGCRWIEPMTDTGAFLAGFQVLRISFEDRVKLRKLLTLISPEPGS